MKCAKCSTKLVTVRGLGVETDNFCPNCEQLELYIVHVPKKTEPTIVGIGIDNHDQKQQ